MALPVILIAASGGDDTQASGAGPATALFGTNDASTDGAGTTVTVTAGTDLTNVATDGSHVIFLNDSTAGNRNFGKITGKAGSGGATPTVTVSNAFGLGLAGKSWAIGGKRQSIGGTTSKKLAENNAGNGDAMPGWVIELESGLLETLSASLNFRRAGDTTTGPIVLRGTAGAATKPILKFSNNGTGIGLVAGYLQFVDFEVQNSNATKTASVAFDAVSNANHIVLRRMKIANSTNKFWRCCQQSNNGPWTLWECELGYGAGTIYNKGNGYSFATFINCWLHDGSTEGITFSDGMINAYGTIIEGNGTHGISGAGNEMLNIIHCTIDGNGSAGFHATGNLVNGYNCFNNIFSNNGTYGWEESGGAAEAEAAGVVAFNDFYNNTSGATNFTPGTYAFVDGQTSDPGFTDRSNNNFAIGPALKALGITTRLIGGPGGATRTYMDIGAAQTQEVPNVTSSSPIIISLGGRVGY